MWSNILLEHYRIRTLPTCSDQCSHCMYSSNHSNPFLMLESAGPERTISSGSLRSPFTLSTLTGASQVASQLSSDTLESAEEGRGRAILLRFGPPCLLSLCLLSPKPRAPNRAFRPPCLLSPLTQAPQITLRTAVDLRGGRGQTVLLGPSPRLSSLCSGQGKPDGGVVSVPRRTGTITCSSLPDPPLRTRFGWGCLVQDLRLQAYPLTPQTVCCSQDCIGRGDMNVLCVRGRVGADARGKGKKKRLQANG
jgi:hypothetical protein